MTVSIRRANDQRAPMAPRGTVGDEGCAPQDWASQTSCQGSGCDLPSCLGRMMRYQIHRGHARMFQDLRSTDPFRTAIGAHLVARVLERVEQGRRDCAAAG